MTLMFMVHGHVVGKAEPKILGFVIHKLLYEDGKVRIDNFEYNLLDPPVNFETGGPRSREVINFTI